MTIEKFGLQLSISFLQKEHEIDLIEATASGPKYLGALFLDIDSLTKEGFLNTSDAVAIIVADILEKEGLIEKASYQNPYGCFPRYLIKL